MGILLSCHGKPTLFGMQAKINGENLLLTSTYTPKYNT